METLKQIVVITNDILYKKKKVTEEKLHKNKEYKMDKQRKKKI